MSQQRKYLVITLAVVVIVWSIVMVISQQDGQFVEFNPQYPEKLTGSQKEALPKPTGKASDAVAATLSEVDSEASLMSEEMEEATEIANLTQEANDLGAAFNELEF